MGSRGVFKYPEDYGEVFWIDDGEAGQTVDCWEYFLEVACEEFEIDDEPKDFLLPLDFLKGDTV